MRQGNQDKTLAQYGYDTLNRLTQVMDGPPKASFVLRAC